MSAAKPVIKPKTRQIDCPSGMVVVLRKMKVREEDILADVEAHRLGVALDEVLGACTVQVVDPGPYRHLERGSGVVVDWTKILQGDRYYALLMLRVTSFTDGESYDFDVRCTSATCRTQIPWTIDLLARPVRALAAEDRAKFEAGNRFECVLPSTETKVVYSLPIGQIERDMLEKQTRFSTRQATLNLMMRIVEVEGKKPSQIVSWIQDLDSDEADWLRAEMEEHDCGVETTIEVVCAKCRNIIERELPFDRTFFSPRSGRRKVVDDLDEGESQIQEAPPAEEAQVPEPKTETEGGPLSTP